MTAALSQEERTYKSLAYRFINEELRIASCRKAWIPEWVIALGKAEDVVSYYCHNQDLIILNIDNVNYELNSKIVKWYLMVSDEQRKEFADYVKTIRFETYVFLKHLNYVLRIRRKLNKKKQKWLGNDNVEVKRYEAERNA